VQRPTPAVVGVAGDVAAVNSDAATKLRDIAARLRAGCEKFGGW
jgi:hypothetical protein